MAEEYNCVGFEKVHRPEWGDSEQYQVSFEKPDGDLHHEVMPPGIFEMRAAEYDLDPDADFVELLDIILHETDVPDFDPDDPAVAEGYVTTDAVGNTVVGNLWTAETLKDAREAHRMRVNKVKQRKNMKVSPELRQAIRQQVRQDRHDGIRAAARDRRQEVRALRRERRGRGDGKPLKG